MAERSGRNSEVEERLREIENELRSLRSALDQQGHVTAQIHSGLARIQAKLFPPKKKSGRQSGLKKKIDQAFESVYLAGARKLLRADVEDLFDQQYYRNEVPGLTESGIDPVFHYLFHKSGISPHWLFDRDYYLATYRDVAAAKVDPLIHFLRIGWREGRNPHPLFKTKYYLEQVPELLSGKLNPVTHYLQTGWHNQLQPHPLMDGAAYLKEYPDVVGAGVDPLSHYIIFGHREGRRPHKWFDSAFYNQRYPDIQRAGMEPLNHYLRFGAAEDRRPHPLFDPIFYAEHYGPIPADMSALEHFVSVGAKRNYRTAMNDCVEFFLPVAPHAKPALRKRAVDIVIPAYRGLEETRACIESVLASSNREPFELIVIDDHSPETALSEWLSETAAEGTLTLLRNETNLGFVASVNRGMSAHADRDVVLLNSDTIVANDWLDRLVACAYQGDKNGTVTPLSNNATICSYPRFCEDNELPPNISIGELDGLAAVVNQGRSVSIPTAVGFCMFIRRDCLRETGLFDVERFGKGYGEENDFSLRAAAKGWRNLLAADVFVYHSGSVSFAGMAGLLRAKSSSVLAERHPKYQAAVSQHVRRDPAQPFRFALTAARFRASGNPTVLLVTHGLGGGIGQHIEELAEPMRGSANFLELQPNGGSLFTLSCADSADGFSIQLDFTRQYDVFLSLLRSCAVVRIHIHQVLNHHLSFENLRDDLNVPMVFTVHDYYTICPRVVLADPDGRYCSEPDEAACNQCIRETLPHMNMDIASWRAKHAWLITTADQVITPSHDAAARLSRYYPGARIEAALHPVQVRKEDMPEVRTSKIGPDGMLRIAVLGVMSFHKGLRNLEACARMAVESELPLEFVLAGYCEDQVLKHGPFSFRETGGYARTDLPGVLEEVDPGLVWFPMRWPETFSYTLSTCLEVGLPVMAPRLGALPERLSQRSWTWLYDWDSEPEALVEMFLNIREAMISGSAPQLPPSRPQADPDFYPNSYRALLQRVPSVIDLREPGRLSVMALLSSYESAQIQSCGYIRAYLPLKHDQMTGAVRLTVTSASSALTMRADVLLVQRTSVENLESAEALLQHCDRYGIRLVYETDDDLFQIDETHAESDFYRSRIAAAELIAGHASMVTVSSPFLKERLEHLNSEIRVIPNALDEGIWFKSLSGKVVKPKRAASNTVRILYMGTMTHAQDLKLLEEPIRLLKEEFGAGLQLDIIGITVDRHNSDWFNVVSVPGVCGHSYPLFVEWLREQNKWDLAVAPLVDNAFNRCKSYIKYLDYGALQLPCVYSGIGVFEGVVKQGETGFCVNGETSWYDALRTLITDRKLRQKMGRAAYLDVEANHTLAAQTELHRELWSQIQSLPPVRSSGSMASFSGETAAVALNGI